MQGSQQRQFRKQLPYRARILNALDAADGLSGQVGSNTADRAEVEAAVFLAGFGNDVCTVAFGDHDVRAAGSHERIGIRVHTVGSCRAHRTAGVAFRSLSRPAYRTGWSLMSAEAVHPYRDVPEA